MFEHEFFGLTLEGSLVSSFAIHTVKYNAVIFTFGKLFVCTNEVDEQI